MNQNTEKKVQRLTRELVQLLEGIREEKNDSMNLFYLIICQIPGVAMVESESVERDYFFKGIINFYSEDNRAITSTEVQRKTKITFAFKKDYEVVINLGFFTGKEIFRGQSFETLNFIFKEVQESTFFLAPDSEQNKKLAMVLKIMEEM